MDYYINDFVHTLTSNGLTHTYSLDPGGRIRNDVTTGTTTATTINHYSGPSGDNPVWTLTSSGTNTTLTRPISDLVGATFAAAVTANGNTTLQVNLLNIHGDVIRTSPLSATTSPSGILTDADEFGNIRNPNLSTTTLVNGPKYGWFGSQLRSADTPNGVIMMGARLYSPILGRFLQRDSLYGGNETPYGYPLDPLMSADLGGAWSFYLPGVRAVVRVHWWGYTISWRTLANARRASHYLGKVSLWQGIVTGVYAYAKRFFVGEKSLTAVWRVILQFKRGEMSSEELWNKLGPEALALYLLMIAIDAAITSDSISNWVSSGLCFGFSIHVVANAFPMFNPGGIQTNDYAYSFKCDGARR
jgi:RHS repeat-associated protein